MFDAIIDCLDACLIIFDKIHVMCHIFKLTSCFMIALEKPFRYALRLSLMVDFLIRHAIFEIT